MTSPQEKFCPYCGSNHERYYSVETAAAILDCSPKTIRGWINDRTIGSVKVGGLRRISAEDLGRIMEKLPSIEQMAKEAMAD